MTTGIELAPADPEQLARMTRGTKTLIIGPPGAGKTTSLVTALQHPKIEKLFVVGTEPGFEESLLDAMAARNLPIDKLHYTYVSPAIESFSSMRNAAQMLNTMSYANLGDLKTGINKHEYKQFFNLLDALSDFKCDRTGESFGPVDQFPENYFLGFDSVTGLNKMVYGLHLGGKPTPHQGEWGVIMQFEEQFISTLVANCKCFLAVTCHVVKGQDQLTGRTNWTVDALGSKLGPRLPYMFSDTPLAIKEGESFYWSTTHSYADLKNRALPIKDKLEPSFVQIINVWEERSKLAAKLAAEAPAS